MSCFMKKCLSLSLVSSSLIFGIIPLKADVLVPAGTIITVSGQSTDQDILFDRELYDANSGDTTYFKFLEDTSCSDPLNGRGTGATAIGGGMANAINQACNDRIGLYIDEQTDGSVKLGNSDATVTINSEGISKSGSNLIKRTSSGELHIGENSWITKEENGRQKVYAKDAAGNSIPIDYTNGTKLLINGRDVEQSINNVGALSAALTGLPTVPTDTTLACGLGTGTYGGDFAFSGGCASKVNEKLSINYAASMTMPGQDYAGDFEDKFSARAGFIWKLGKSTKKPKISLNKKKEIDLKISKLENDNEELKHENQKIISKYIQLENKNNEIISQNIKILTMLKKLENIAFELHKNNELKISKEP